MAKEADEKNTKKPSLNKIIVFDLETTGLPEVGEIIEIGAIKYCKKHGQKKYKILNIFSERIKPQTNFWSPMAAKTHNIKKEQLQNCRIIDQVLLDFLKFLEEDYVVVGHRVGFDCVFIRKFCEICKFPIPKNIVLDTYKIAINVYELDKKLAKLNFKDTYEVHLSDLMKHFRVTYTLGNKHRAYIDAYTTAQIFFKMKNGYKISELTPMAFDTIKFEMLQSLLKENKQDEKK